MEEAKKKSTNLLITTPQKRNKPIRLTHYIESHIDNTPSPTQKYNFNTTQNKKYNNLHLDYNIPVITEEEAKDFKTFNSFSPPPKQSSQRGKIIDMSKTILKLVNTFENLNKKNCLSQSNINQTQEIQLAEVSILRESIKSESNHKSIMTLPSLFNTNAVNKFMINTYANENDPKELIKSSRKRRTISNNFFSRLDEKIKSSAIQLNEQFEKAKRINNLDDLIEEDKKAAAFEEMMKYDLKPVKDYKVMKEISEYRIKKYNEQQAKTYASLVIRSLTNDNICKKKRFDDDDVLVLKDTLSNFIYRRKILKSKLKLTEDEEVGLGAFEDMKTNIKIIEEGTARALKNTFRSFVKQKLKISTTSKYRSLKGKFFGVAC